MFEMPLFPLQTVLFPNMPIQLHIFEDRYKQMIRRCLQEEIAFGVVLIRAGLEVYEQEVEIYTTGCSARILEVEHLKEGKMNLAARGEQRFRILKTSRVHPYLSAQVETLPLEWHDHPAATYNLNVFRRQMRYYLKILSLIHTEGDDLSRLELPDDPLLLLNLASSILQIPVYEKQDLLEVQNGTRLLENLQHMYRRETAVLKAIQMKGDNPSEQEIRNN
jgi:Lon protease-like protein